VAARGGLVQPQVLREGEGDQGQQGVVVAADPRAALDVVGRCCR
jgi:hypothetical protein